MVIRVSIRIKKSYTGFSPGNSFCFVFKGQQGFIGKAGNPGTPGNPGPPGPPVSIKRIHEFEYSCG